MVNEFTTDTRNDPLTAPVVEGLTETRRGVGAWRTVLRVDVHPWVVVALDGRMQRLKTVYVVGENHCPFFLKSLVTNRGSLYLLLLPLI